MKIVVIGATGFIGKALVPKLLQDGHQVTAWVRSRKTATGLPCSIEVTDFFDVQTMTRKLSGSDVVINLAGEPVSNTKWTPEFKKRFLESRTVVTRNLVSVLNQLPESERPRVLLNASAIGWYGDRAQEVLTEKSTPGDGFLAEVCHQWENEVRRVESIHIRSVILRIGIVLGRSGGMLTKLMPVRLGSGEQWVSWIHLDDVVEMIRFSIKNDQARGPINIVSPNPVQQDEMNRFLAEKYHLPYFSALAVPPSILKVAVGELAQVVLASQRCIPQFMIDAGFKFRFSHLREALNDIFGGREELGVWYEFPLGLLAVKSKIQKTVNRRIKKIKRIFASGK